MTVTATRPSLLSSVSVVLTRHKITPCPECSSVSLVSRLTQLIVVLVTDLSLGQPLSHPVLVNDPPPATPTNKVTTDALTFFNFAIN